MVQGRSVPEDDHVTGTKTGAKDTLPVNEKALEVFKARAKVRSLKYDYILWNGAGNRTDARDLLRVFYRVMKKQM